MRPLQREMLLCYPDAVISSDIRLRAISPPAESDNRLHVDAAVFLYFQADVLLKGFLVKTTLSAKRDF